MAKLKGKDNPFIMPEGGHELNKEACVALYYKQEIFSKTHVDSLGNYTRARRNGICKVWKGDPDRFILPVKHGLSQCFDITESNCHEWFWFPRGDQK